MRQIPLLLALSNPLVSLLEMLRLILMNADAFLVIHQKVISTKKYDLNVFGSNDINDYVDDGKHFFRGQ